MLFIYLYPRQTTLETKALLLMKLYTSLGDLLMAFRHKQNMSQGELAGLIDVDIRTVQRWERNTTLVKPEKEPALVEATLLPHQLIRNLNSTYPIPTYFDFDLRKYSLTELDIDLPDIALLKKQINMQSEYIKEIRSKEELENIIRYINYRNESKHQIATKVLNEARINLTALNLNVTDTYGFYAGHSIILSIKENTYQKLRNREIYNQDLVIDDLIDFRTVEKPIFYIYSITADSNSTLTYLVAAILRFFKSLESTEYTLATLTPRDDNKAFNQSIGLTNLWNEAGFNKEEYYSFWEGKLDHYLNSL